MAVYDWSYGLITVISLLMGAQPLPTQAEHSMLPVDAWKYAGAASSWDRPQAYLPTVKKPALFLIDAQENFRLYYGTSHGNDAVHEMHILVEAFRSRCLPIVFKLWPMPPDSEELRKTETCVPIVPLKEAAPSTESEANRTVKYVEFDEFWKNPHLDHLLETWDVDHVVVAGGFTEHCVIATANALWSRKIPAVIPASAVGPRNSTDEMHRPNKSPSLQHEAALIAMQSSVAQVVSNSSTIIKHLESHSIKGSICPESPIAAPAADYMKHAFPKEQEGFCNTTLHPSVNASGIDRGLGAWPLWAPLEAKMAAALLNSESQEDRTFQI